MNAQTEANLNAEPTEQGRQTALHVACMNGHETVARLLIANDCRVDMADEVAAVLSVLFPSACLFSWGTFAPSIPLERKAAFSPVL